MTTSTLSMDDRTAALDAMAKEIRSCTKCPLHAQGRLQAVPGAGPYNAEIMFIGEGPGFNEDKQGIPFIGPSGRFLEEMLATINLTRDQVFITNVVRCRPPENRDPAPIEVETCTHEYLYKQIELINPLLIATLGRFSMGLFFPGAKITGIQGKPKWEDGRVYIPFFHPAAVLRNMGLKPQVEAAFKQIPKLIAEAKARSQATSGAKGQLNQALSALVEDDDKPEPPPTPTQLSLF